MAVGHGEVKERSCLEGGLGIRWGVGADEGVDTSDCFLHCSAKSFGTEAVLGSGGGITVFFAFKDVEEEREGPF